jgi:hypothetical protein
MENRRRAAGQDSQLPYGNTARLFVFGHRMAISYGEVTVKLSYFTPVS